MNNINKNFIVLALLCCGATAAFSQDCNSLLRRATELVSQGNYCDALQYFRRYSNCDADADVSTQIAMCERRCRLPEGNEGGENQPIPDNRYSTNEATNNQTVSYPRDHIAQNSVYDATPLNYYWFLGTIRQNGVVLNPKQVREIMSTNEHALRKYNTGLVFGYIQGGIGIACLGLIVGGIFEPSLMYFAGIGALGIQFPIAMIGWTIISNSIKTYNSGLRNIASYQIDFGFTPTGIGLSMRF